MMSNRTNRIQNSLLQEPDGGDGFDFEFIMDTINEAPEDLKKFAEILRDELTYKIGVPFRFEDGFVLSDRMNQVEIDRLNKQIELLEYKLKVVIENGLGPEDLKPQDV